MNRTQINKMVLTALFTAIVCVATMVIRIPVPATGGYVNIGDTMVLAAAWILGGPYGFFAAGLGSGLADLLSGCGVYVPGTFLIKFCMAVSAYAFYQVLKDQTTHKTLNYILSGAAAEIVMVTGYFLFEAFVLGYGTAAAASAISNILQGGINLVLGISLMEMLEKSRALNLIRH